jgi:hypothetical protein
VVRPTTDRKAILAGVDNITPDSNAGRFVESLNEALQRNERDKSDFFPIIIALGTTMGDTRVLDRDLNQIMERLEKRPDDGARGDLCRPARRLRVAAWYSRSSA